MSRRVRLYKNRTPVYNSQPFGFGDVPFVYKDPFIIFGANNQGIRYSDLDNNLTAQVDAWNIFNIWDLSLDRNGNTYLSQGRQNNITNRKYDHDRNLLWSIDLGADSYAIKSDVKGEFVYICTESTGNNLYKLDTDGNIIWSVSRGTLFNDGVSIDEDGNVYGTSDRSNSITTRKYDKDGNLIWSLDFGAYSAHINVDYDNNRVYVVGVRNNNQSLKVYDLDGDFIFGRDHGGTLRGVNYDTFGNILVVGDRVSNITTRKYDILGNLLWSVDWGANVGSVDTDSFGNIYTFGQNGGGGSNNLGKYDTDGNLIWARNYMSPMSGLNGQYNGLSVYNFENLINLDYSSQLVSTDIGSLNWGVNETRQVTIRVRNNGNKTWFAPNGVISCPPTNNEIALAYKWNDDPWYDSYSNNRNPLPHDVLPGQEVDITLDIQPPNGGSGLDNIGFLLVVRECLWFDTRMVSPQINVS